MDSEPTLADLRRQLAELRTAAFRIEQRLDQLEREQNDDALNQTVFDEPAPVTPPPVPEPKPKTVVKPAPVSRVAKYVEEKTPAPERKPLPRLKPQEPSWLQTKMREWGPPKDVSWEIALTTYWFPRIGIAVVSVGIVFLATLAVQYFQGAWWMPHARVAVGYAIAALLLGVGVRAQSKDQSYGQLLLGGGFGMTYFITFAAHYVPFTRVIHSPTIAYLLLAAIVAGWAALAVIKRSKLLGLTSIASGHFTIALSTLLLPEPSRMGVVGLIAITVGAGFLLLRYGWLAATGLAMAGAYANHFFWLVRAPQPEVGWTALTLGLSVIAIYFFVYALAEFFSPKSAREAAPLSLRNAYVSINTAAAFLLGLLTWYGAEMGGDTVHIYYTAFGAVLIALGVGYWQLRDRDPLLNTYIAKGTGVLTLALAAYFEGAALLASLSVEIVVLLFVAQKSRLPVSRALAHVAGAAALVYGLWTFVIAGRADFALDAATLVPSSIALLSFFGAAAYYRMNTWDVYFGERTSAKPPRASLLRWLDLRAPHDGYRAWPEGQPIPYAYATGGAILLILGSLSITEFNIAAAMLAIAALGLGTIGGLLQQKALTTAGVISAAASAATYVGAHMDSAPVEWLHVVLVLAPLAALMEVSRLINGTRGDVWLFARKGLPYEDARLPLLPMLLGVTVAFLLAVHGIGELGRTGTAWIFAAALLASVAYARYVQGQGFAATALTLFGLLIPLSAGMAHPNTSPAALAALLAGGGIAAALSDPRTAKPSAGLALLHLRGAPYVTYGATAWATFQVLSEHWSAPYASAALLGLAIGAAALSLVLHTGALSCVSVAWLLAAATRWAPSEGQPVVAWLTGAAVIVVALGLERFTARTRHILYPPLAALLAGTLLLFGMHYLQALPIGNYGLAAEGLYMMALFVFAGAFRSVPVFAASFLGTLFIVARLISLGLSGSDDYTNLELIAAYAPVLLYGFCLERALRIALAEPDAIPERFREQLEQAREPLAAAFSFTTVGLLIFMLSQLPGLRDFYLTLSWSIAAIAAFGIAVALKQKFYRYAALATLMLALVRVLVIDTMALDGVYRIIAWIFLGLTLLGVGYAYVYARSKLPQDNEKNKD